MKVSFPHGTTRSEAMELLKAGNAQLISRFGRDVSDLKQEWQEDGLSFAFRAQGFSVSGRMVVGERNVDMVLDLPGLAGLFEGPIREKALETMRETFGPKTDGKGQRT